MQWSNWGRAAAIAVALGRGVARAADGDDPAVVLDEIEVKVRAEPLTDTLEPREVRETSARDLGEGLTLTPGVEKVRKGGIANDVVLRGMKRDDVAVAIDGAHVHGACPSRMDPPAFHVDYAEVDRVLVRRGPFDVTQPGGLGGVIDVRTRRAARLARPAGTRAGRERRGRPGREVGRSRAARPGAGVPLLVPRLHRARRCRHAGRSHRQELRERRRADLRLRGLGARRAAARPLPLRGRRRDAWRGRDARGLARGDAAGEGQRRAALGRRLAEVEESLARRQGQVDARLREEATPAWAITNVRAGGAWRGVKVFAGARNLFDRHYFEHLSYARDPFAAGVKIPEPGRTLYLNAQLAL